MTESRKNCEEKGKSLANDTDESELTASKFYQKQIKFLATANEI